MQLANTKKKYTVTNALINKELFDKNKKHIDTLITNLLTEESTERCNIIKKEYCKFELLLRNQIYDFECLLYEQLENLNTSRIKYAVMSKIIFPIQKNQQIPEQNKSKLPTYKTAITQLPNLSQYQHITPQTNIPIYQQQTIQTNIPIYQQQTTPNVIYYTMPTYQTTQSYQNIPPSYQFHQNMQSNAQHILPSYSSQQSQQNILPIEQIIANKALLNNLQLRYGI